LSECSRCTSPTRRPTTSRNSASENASSDAASGNDMPAVNHAYAFSATASPGNLPRLRNHERNLLEGDDTSSSVAFARPRLSAAHLDWIKGLPGTLQVMNGEVFACHGSPAGGDLDYLLEDVESGRPILAYEDAIRPRLAGIGPARLVLCGHTHMPRVVQVGDVLVVNPGSIGMPAYTDDNPVPHAMETGAPHARYAVVTRRPGGIWSAELRAVAYDWDRAAQQAQANGTPAVARWTASGRA